VERLILLLQQQDGLHLSPAIQADIFVASLGEDVPATASPRAFAAPGGVKAAMDHSGRSLKAQMKQAGRLGARFALIIGDNELAQENAVLRDMASQSRKISVCRALAVLRRQFTYPCHQRSPHKRET